VTDSELYSDEARRASEQINLHLVADRERALHSWIAIRLSDGGSDGILYDRRVDAVRHQLHETQCMYLKVQPGITPKIAERLLAIHRQVYDAGMRMASVDEDRELIIPMNLEDILRMSPR
jgi:hypothetical protein